MLTPEQQAYVRAYTKYIERELLTLFENYTGQPFTEEAKERIKEETVKLLNELAVKWDYSIDIHDDPDVSDRLHVSIIMAPPPDYLDITFEV